MGRKGAIVLSSLSSNSSGQLDILWHDGDSLGVDGAQVGVLEETDQIGLGRLLQSSDRSRLESQVGLEVLGDLANQTLKWQLADQQLGWLLVSSDLTESNCTWAVSVRLLDSTSGWGWLSCSFGGQLLSWGFATSWLSCGLLSTSHFIRLVRFSEVSRRENKLKSCWYDKNVMNEKKTK